MKDKYLYFIWGVLFVACMMLGIKPDTQGLEKIAMVVLSVVFFIPGFILVLDAVKNDDRKKLRLIRILSIASLSLTTVFLVASTAAVGAEESVGQVLHAILLVVSTPMLCSQYWALSLFLWAALLMLSIPDRKKKEKKL